jgi:hypothetical protein
MNPADETLPTEKTDAVLQKMIKQGYLVKVAEARAAAGDDEAIIWYVGPRGKVEVDKDVLAAFVRTVYGGSSPDLEQKLQTSLKVAPQGEGVLVAVGEEPEGVPPDGDPGPSTRRRSRRRQTEVEENSE